MYLEDYQNSAEITIKTFCFVLESKGLAFVQTLKSVEVRYRETWLNDPCSGTASPTSKRAHEPVMGLKLDIVLLIIKLPTSYNIISIWSTNATEPRC